MCLVRDPVAEGTRCWRCAFVCPDTARSPTEHRVCRAAGPAQFVTMNWNSKEYNEIALNKIWSEHVSAAVALFETTI